MYVNTTEKTYTLMNVFLFVAWKQGVCFPYRHISLTVKMQKGCLLNGDKIMGQMYFGNKNLNDKYRIVNVRICALNM